MLILRDLLRLRQDVSLGQRTDRHTNREHEQTQQPVLGSARDGPVEGYVREVSFKVLVLVALDDPPHRREILLRSPGGGHPHRSELYGLPSRPQFLQRQLVRVQQQGYRVRQVLRYTSVV